MLKFGFSLVVVVATVLVSADDNVCMPKALCVCHTADGVIDLSYLDKTIFNITDSTGTRYFTFNPCTPLNLGPDCDNVLGCQINPLPTRYSAIASSDDYEYQRKGDVFSIKYSSNGKNSMIVTLVCNPDTEGALIFNNENPKNVLNFDLTTKYACLDAALTTIPVHSMTTKPDQHSTTSGNPTTSPRQSTTSRSTSPTPSTSSPTPTSPTPKSGSTSPKQPSSSTPQGSTTPHNGTTGPTVPSTTPGKPKTSNTPGTNFTTLTTVSTTSGASSLGAIACLMVLFAMVLSKMF